MCVFSRFDPLSGNSQLAISNRGKRQILHSSQLVLPIFWGGKDSCVPCVAAGLCVWLHSEGFNPIAEGIMYRADAGRADFFPFICWAGLCTSSLLRMGTPEEEKSLAKSLTLPSLCSPSVSYGEVSGSSQSFP